MLKTTLSVVLLLAFPLLTLQIRSIENPDAAKCVEMFPSYAQSFSSLLSVLNSQDMNAIVEELKKSRDNFRELALNCNIRIPDFPTILGNSKNCLRGVADLKPLLERLTNYRPEQSKEVSGYVLLVTSIAGLANRIPRTLGDCAVYLNTNN